MKHELLWALQPETAQAFLAGLAGYFATPETARRGSSAGAEAALPSGGMNSAPGYELVDGIAVIEMNGVITRASTWRGYAVGQDIITLALHGAVADPKARGILLSFNSPGGVVAGTKELADKISAAAKIKPMAAYADGLMASAAFWLGSATGRVYAPLTGSLGSIGVIQLHADISKFNERLGIAYTYITAGRFKAAGNEDSPLDEASRALFQKRVDQLHSIFKSDVSSALGLTAPESAWAEGQTFLAEEARTLGLVQAIVQDRQAAITQFRKEISMDYATLAAQHPELLAQIKTEASTEAKTAMAAALEQEKTGLLALIGLVAGEAAQTAVQGLIEAKVTPEQIQALATLFPAQPKAATPKEQAAPPATESVPDKKDAILAALQKATPGVLGGGVPPAAGVKSPLVADAERRAERAAQAQNRHFGM